MHTIALDHLLLSQHIIQKKKLMEVQKTNCSTMKSIRADHIELRKNKMPYSVPKLISTLAENFNHITNYQDIFQQQLR